MEFKIMKASDVEENRKAMIALMDMILSDNITQKYPDDQAEQYVDKIPGYIEDGSAIVAGALEAGVLVGFSWAYELSIFEERRIHIDMIGVAPQYQKQGVAKKLVELQEKEAKKRGIHIMEAMATKANGSSYHWFHSLGFADERVKVRRDLEF